MTEEEPVANINVQSVNIPPPPEFTPDSEVGASLATRWITWMDDFEMFLTASGIKDDTQKRALLLYQAGSRVREIFRQLPETGNTNDYKIAKDKLRDYFEPQKNRRYEVFKFRQAKQEPNETLDQFHTRLRVLAQTCSFNDTEFEIEQQIIVNGISSRIRKKALREPDYDLKQILLDGRRAEQSEFQARDIESKEDKTDSIQQVQTKTCHYCGGTYPHNSPCPAKGKECKKCGKLNHFAKVCRGKQKPASKPLYPRHKRNERKHKKPLNPIQQPDSESDSPEDYLYTVHATKKAPTVRVKVGQHCFDATLDTGASLNVIDRATYEHMDGVQLKRTNVKAFVYNAQTPVKFLGKFEALIETRKRVTVATFYVVKTPDSGNLISSTTAQDLGLISLHINKLSNTKDKKLDKILTKHATVFEGLGKLNDVTIKLNIDPEQTPKTQPTRRIPFHIRDQVKHALEALEQDDVIERVPDKQPTPWVSPIVAVPKKDGGVRICVDMRQANAAIKRVRHPIPTVEDISLELNGAKYFSKLDLSQAYHQLELHEDSRYITTFTTHVGLFRYKRLNYGTNAAAELFQHTLQQQLQGLTGVRNIADDIIVYGQTREEHDTAIDNCLQRLYDRGFRLNKSKCRFLSSSLDFFGQVFSEAGIQPDPKRVTDLRNAPRPQNVHEVRSLLGMANYSCKYIANFATITTPLRELTKKNAKFEWNETHQKAFDQLTSALTSAPCMAYFDMHKDTFVTVDASPVGLSAILSQRTPGQDDNKVISYASRALTAVETRYSQTEKEALAIVWGIEHFHLYLYGKEFTLITDHKPLEVIYGSKSAKVSARIERWILRLQPYTFKVVYKPGATNPADYLSRHPTQSSRKQEHLTEEYVNFKTSTSIPKTMTMDEIITATNSDRALQGLRAAIKIDKWDCDIVKPYKQIKDELTVTSQGIVLRGNRIVIPQSLQQRAIDIAHDTHLGLSKTKALLREKIWFPHIDQQVKKTLEGCISCQAVGRLPPPEPLGQTKMPKGPWEVVHTDFYGPLPTGEYLLVVIDRYSRFPEVEIVRSTKASAVIPKLDKIFATHGIPTVLKSDNGPPYNSKEYESYLEALRIKPEFSTPYWPQGNAEAERFMQPLGKALKTAQIQGRPWQQELHRFLLQYRTAPHSTTGVPPAELLFNRTVKGKLPILNKRNVVNRHKQARENEALKQQYNKQYADNRRNAKQSDIKIGDSVLVRQKRSNKLSTNFSSVPYTVITKHNSKVTVRDSNGRTITRNVTHFKRIPNQPNAEPDTDEENDNNNGNDCANNNTQAGNNQPERTNNEEVRRSSRERKMPERYGHAISWTLHV